MRAMKDSGVEWIGEIPAEWEIGRVKNIFIRKNEKAMLENPVVLSLARAGVHIRDISNNEGQIALSYYNYNPVDVGDLLLNPMDLYSGANCSISRVKGVISPAYVNLKGKNNVDARYYDYYFKVQYWQMVFFSYGKGVSFENRWTLTNETLMNFKVLMLSYSEQQRIADYLDKKCAEIDAIISKQHSIIEKLQEYKLSLITETVTKGLNADAEMKDSGIEWIGEIPKHWKIKKLKYITKSIGDGIHSTPSYDDNGNIFFVNGNNIGEDSLVLKESTSKINEEEYYRYKLPALNNNTILITLNGATYGKTSFYNQEKILLGKSAGYIILNESENKKFLRYYLQSYYSKQSMDLSLLGSTIQNLSLKTLRNFNIVYPSLNEQKDIVCFLDKKCMNIESIINKKNSIIEKLTEYKKSLIYEVVTGKKEV